MKWQITLSPLIKMDAFITKFDLMRLAKIGVYLKSLYVMNTVNMTGPRGQYRMDLHNLDLFITNTDVDI